MKRRNQKSKGRFARVSNAALGYLLNKAAPSEAGAVPHAIKLIGIKLLGVPEGAPTNFVLNVTHCWRWFNMGKEEFYAGLNLLTHTGLLERRHGRAKFAEESLRSFPTSGFVLIEEDLLFEAPRLVALVVLARLDPKPKHPIDLALRFGVSPRTRTAYKLADKAVQLGFLRSVNLGNDRLVTGRPNVDLSPFVIKKPDVTKSQVTLPQVTNPHTQQTCSSSQKDGPHQKDGGDQTNARVVDSSAARGGGDELIVERIVLKDWRASLENPPVIDDFVSGPTYAAWRRHMESFGELPGHLRGVQAHRHFAQIAKHLELVLQRHWGVSISLETEVFRGLAHSLVTFAVTSKKPVRNLGALARSLADRTRQGDVEWVRASPSNLDDEQLAAADALASRLGQVAARYNTPLFEPLMRGTVELEALHELMPHDETVLAAQIQRSDVPSGSMVLRWSAFFRRLRPAAPSSSDTPVKRTWDFPEPAPREPANDPDMVFLFKADVRKKLSRPLLSDAKGLHDLLDGHVARMGCANPEEVREARHRALVAMGEALKGTTKQRAGGWVFFRECLAELEAARAGEQAGR